MYQPYYTKLDIVGQFPQTETTRQVPFVSALAPVVLEQVGAIVCRAS